MAIQIMSFISWVLEACGVWFQAVMEATGLVYVFLAFVAVVFAVRFLLAPVFGGNAGSDKATSNRKEKTNG